MERGSLHGLWITFASSSPMLGGVGEMRRRMAWENEQSARYASTVAICASIICAVRLARDDINHPSPRVLCAVADSIALAKMILKRVSGR